MVRTVCCWLLRLSPSRFRRDFGDEVMEIVSLRLSEEGRSFGFVLRELWGLVGLAWAEREKMEWPVPVVGGVGVALVLHGLLYSVVGMLLRKGYVLFAQLDQFGEKAVNQPVVIGFYALFGFLLLIPVFLVMAFRIRHARTARSLKVV